MTRLATYWHTVRYLKAGQLYGRVAARMRRVRPDLRPPPPLRPVSGEWAEPARRKPSLVGPAEFRLLNECHSVDANGWDDPELERLWRYNLHYFDDLNAEDAGERRPWHAALLARWVRENAPGAGTGWEAYPTSLRIVNWIKWTLAGNRLPPECLHSLAVQARWLSQHIETHLLGNHLLSNAKALMFAGLVFQGPEAQAWTDTAAAIFDDQIGEQILDDGAHFERSTMYHALAFEDVLDLMNVMQAFARELPLDARAIGDRLRARAPAMGAWLTAMCHPDGDIAFFNDAAFGVAPAPAELRAYAARLYIQVGEPADTLHFVESGYARACRGPAVLLFDVAPVGPDYLPAHAHADTLSFELSLFGQRLFVNSGTSCYGSSPERVRQRGTAAHNTVVVDGQDSSEVWGGFRVARRAHPQGLSITSAGETFDLSCAHDGYARLRGRPAHKRRWTFGATRMVVEDELRGRYSRAQARYHLHPAVRVSDASSNALALHVGDRRVHFSVRGARLRRERSTWHPQFGGTEPNECLAVDFDGPSVQTTVEWSNAT